MGYELHREFTGGRSWRLGAGVQRGRAVADLTADRHDRCRLGLNHLAFHAGEPADVDRLTVAAVANGWQLLFADRPTIGS